jgi:hypothetical protein
MSSAVQHCFQLPTHAVNPDCIPSGLLIVLTQYLPEEPVPVLHSRSYGICWCCSAVLPRVSCLRHCRRDGIHFEEGVWVLRSKCICRSFTWLRAAPCTFGVTRQNNRRNSTDGPRLHTHSHGGITCRECIVMLPVNNHPRLNQL